MCPDPLHTAEARHSLTSQQFRELAHGGGGLATLTELARAELSHRLLLLDLLLDAVQRSGVTAPLPAAERAWDLLAAAQQHRPQQVRELVLLPETGLWLNRLLARLRGGESEDIPLWADIGHLHALAATAALHAGLNFSFPIPAHSGTVWLPALGQARLSTARTHWRTWDTAEVRVHAGRPTVIGEYGQVRLPASLRASGPGWSPVRELALGESAGPRRIVVDDLGRHRIAPLSAGAPRRLSHLAHRSWARLLSEACELLATVDPPTADAAATLLRSLQPMPAHEALRVRSASSAHAVGGITSSVPDSVVLCAATLVHELQHSKLAAVMHLYPLYKQPGAAKTDPPRSYYAPWRDDPRPLGGMLQGAYAFAAVGRFWQALARLPHAHERSLARFESALWSAQVARVLPSLAADPALTALGRDALGYLLDAVDRRRATGGAGPEETLAAALAADHRTSWLLAHSRPWPEDVERLAAAWRQASDRPPEPPPRRRLEVVDSGARHLDARAMLVRLRLADPATLDKLRAQGGDTVPEVSGADRADLLWACGDYPAAMCRYLRAIAEDGATATVRPSSWSGLRLVLAGTGQELYAVRALTAVPEVIAAVHRAVTGSGGRPPEPTALARWLGRSLTDVTSTGTDSRCRDQSSWTDLSG